MTFLPDELLTAIHARAAEVDAANTFPDADLADLRAAGYLAAFVPTDFGGAGLTLEEVFADHLPGLGIPGLKGLRCGHGKLNLTLPLGIRVEVDGDLGRLTALEAALS